MSGVVNLRACLTLLQFVRSIARSRRAVQRAILAPAPGQEFVDTHIDFLDIEAAGRCIEQSQPRRQPFVVGIFQLFPVCRAGQELRPFFTTIPSETNGYSALAGLGAADSLRFDCDMG